MGDLMLSLRHAVLVLVVVVLTAACSSAGGEATPATTDDSSSAPAVEDEEQIRTVFDDYRNALLAGDGDAAFETISQSSVDFYVGMRDLALTAPRREMEKRSLIDRLHALTLRYVLAPQRLEGMTPIEIVAYAVDVGLIGQGTLQLQELEEVAVDGDTAESTVTSDGNEAEFTYTFVRDEGGWRLNLLVVLDVANERFIDLVAKEGITETAFIFDTIEVITGQRPTNVLWNAPNPG